VKRGTSRFPKTKNSSSISLYDPTFQLWVPTLHFNLQTGAWSSGVHFVVGRPGFDSLAESDQTLKVGIYSFLAWRSAFKRVSVEIGRQVRLLCPWTRYLTGLPLPLSGKLVVIDGSLTAWLEKVPSLSSGRGTLTNK